jgi:hypothetical protein
MNDFGMSTGLLLMLKVVIGKVQTAELEIEDDSVPAALYCMIVKVIGQTWIYPSYRNRVWSPCCLHDGLCNL